MREVRIHTGAVKNIICPHQLEQEIWCTVDCAWFHIGPLDSLHEHPDTSCEYAYCKDHCIGKVK